MKIFVSYRRNENENDLIRHFVERLTREFGEDSVFFDETGIKGGENIKEEIKDELFGSSIFLSMIGERWHQSNENGSDIDYVQLETESALSLERNGRCRVIPILLNEVDLPEQTELSDPFREVLKSLGLKLRGNDFDVDTKKIIARIKSLSFKERARKRSCVITLSLTFVMLLLVAIPTVLFMSPRKEEAINFPIEFTCSPQTPNGTSTSVSSIAFDESRGLFVSGSSDDAFSILGADQRIIEELDLENGAFLVNLDPAQGLRWKIEIAANDLNPGRVFNVNSLSMTDSGVVLFGVFAGSLDFDPSDSKYILSTSSTKDEGIYIAKYSFDGELLWARTIQGKRDDFVSSEGLKIDSKGRIHLVAQTDTEDSGGYQMSFRGNNEGGLSQYEFEINLPEVEWFSKKHNVGFYAIISADGTKLEKVSEFQFPNAEFGGPLLTLSDDKPFIALNAEKKHGVENEMIINGARHNLDPDNDRFVATFAPSSRQLPFIIPSRDLLFCGGFIVNDGQQLFSGVNVDGSPLVVEKNGDGLQRLFELRFKNSEITESKLTNAMRKNVFHGGSETGGFVSTDMGPTSFIRKQVRVAETSVAFDELGRTYFGGTQNSNSDGRLSGFVERLNHNDK